MVETTLSSGGASQEKGGPLDPARALAPSPLARLFRRLGKHGGIVFGGAFLSAVLFMAIFAPILAPHDQYAQDITNRFVPPMWMDGGSPDHILGTDHLGRDFLSRLIYGSQIALIIGFAVAFISGVIGCVLGVLAGYFGGRVDSVISFIIMTRLTLPIFLVALALVAIAGPSLEMVLLVLGFLLWDRYAVVMRSATQQVRALDYVASAQAIGCSTRHIVMSEIMPNVLNNLIVIATFEVAHAIILEASLSFLGLGVQPPAPSWGLMIAESKDHLLFDPWLVVIPGIALSILVLAVNMLGDGIRDVTAPENRS